MTVPSCSHQCIKNYFVLKEKLCQPLSECRGCYLIFVFFLRDFPRVSSWPLCMLRSKEGSSERFIILSNHMTYFSGTRSLLSIRNYVLLSHLGNFAWKEWVHLSNAILTLHIFCSLDISFRLQCHVIDTIKSNKSKEEESHRDVEEIILAVCWGVFWGGEGGQLFLYEKVFS